MPIRVEKEDVVTTVIIDNPKVKNAVNGATARALADAFREFEKDKNAKVAVLWGDHGSFCAGANLKKIVDGGQNLINSDMSADGPMGPSRMILSKPVIAAVAGYAVAGGLELALWCDLRVVERDAVFGVFCRRFGVPLIDGGTVRLPRLIGLSRALDLILTGRPVHADEALAIGLANRIVDVGQSRPEAEKLAREIAAFPQTCMIHDRLSAYEQFDLNFKEAMANEFKHGMVTLFSGETLKGAKQFKKGVGKHGQFYF
ncbi:MAG: crotonase/enoyl-CoA hydratase family protein [Promethearchaeota archaeon]